MSENALSSSACAERALTSAGATRSPPSRLECTWRQSSNETARQQQQRPLGAPGDRLRDPRRDRDCPRAAAACREHAQGPSLDDAFLLPPPPQLRAMTLGYPAAPISSGRSSSSSTAFTGRSGDPSRTSHATSTASSRSMPISATVRVRGHDPRLPSAAGRDRGRPARGTPLPRARHPRATVRRRVVASPAGRREGGSLDPRSGRFLGSVPHR